MRRSTPRSRRILPLLIAAIVVSPALASPLALAPGDDAPDLRGYGTADGAPVLVRTDDGLFTLVNFWATWCEPCRDEMPALQALHERYPDRLQVVGVLRESVDNETVRTFLDDLGVTYPNVRPNAKRIADWGGLGVFPTTFLIGPDGTVVRRYVGASAAQIEGLAADVAAAIEGRELPPLVMPGASGSVTNADRPRDHE